MVCILVYPLRTLSLQAVACLVHTKMAVILPRLADILLPSPVDLRAQLAAAINPSQHHNGPPNPPQHDYNDPRASNSASPREHHLDPSMNTGAQAQMMSASALAAGDSGGDDNGGKGGKRELSQSKRAAQNRAAQVRLVFWLLRQHCNLVCDTGICHSQECFS